MKVEKLTREELLKLEGKYVFHGSASLFDVVKPHQAKCDTKNPANEQFAIYGSIDLIFSILFAFPKMPLHKYKWGSNYLNGKYVGVLYNETYIDEEAKGYIYCFDKKYFKQTSIGSAQYVCKKQLEPACVYEIEYKDYKDCFKKELDLQV